MKKRLLSILMALALCLSLMPVTALAADPAEQFPGLTPGETYWFDLSGADIPGNKNSSLPDDSLHWVPFTYVGTVNAYVLKNRSANDDTAKGDSANAAGSTDPSNPIGYTYDHSLFIADYNLTSSANWSTLNGRNLIFGMDYTSGGVDYILRAPSAGSGSTGSQDSERGTPQNNEWDVILDKANQSYQDSTVGYIKNWNGMASWGQDTQDGPDPDWNRATRGSFTACSWQFDLKLSPSVGFRPVLELPSSDTLGSDGLTTVTLDLNGGSIGSITGTVNLAVKSDFNITLPGVTDVTRPDGNDGTYFKWQDSSGNLYEPGAQVSANVGRLTALWKDSINPVITGLENGKTYCDAVEFEVSDNGGIASVKVGDEVLIVGTNGKYTLAKGVGTVTVVAKDNAENETSVTVTVNNGHTGGAATYFKRAVCDICEAEYGELLTDKTVPTGEISIGRNKWNSFLNTITFGIFFKDTQSVTITASDDSYDHTGYTEYKAVKVGYYLYSGDTALEKADLAGKEFTEYDRAFNINPDNKYVVYARLTDHAGNVTYISSEGIVLDSTAPVISGVENGKVYCEEQTVTVTEEYITSVTVNGTGVTLDANNQFTLSPAEGTQTIVVTDKAGNVSAENTVTVNNGHTADNDDGDCSTPVYCIYHPDAVVVEAKSHDFSGEWNNNENGHWHTCQNDGCNVAETETPHSGTDDGDCTTAVICECGYIITAANAEHTYEWQSENGQYWQKCKYCEDETAKMDIPTVTITGADSVCITQDYKFSFTLPEGATDALYGYEFEYVGASGLEPIAEDGALYGVVSAESYDSGANSFKICVNAKTADGFDISASKTVALLSEHTDAEPKDHVCDICGATISGHTGGEAACGGKAVCEYCGEEYGEVDSSNHNLENIPAKAATVTETGNMEYWHCLNCGRYFSDKDARNSIELKDTITQKLPPEIIDGMGQTVTEGEKKTLTFSSNAAFGDFIRVEINGETLDEKYYTVKEGSTVVTLKADYAATLSVGEYTIGIVSESGTAATTFTVNAKTAADNDKKTPQTGDNSHMALLIALLFVSGGLLTVTVIKGVNTESKRKNRYE